jgi:hypothetical protein
MSAKKTNPTHKAWAKYFYERVGGEVAVHEYLDESEETAIDVLVSTTDEGIVATTIGLMEFDQSENDDIALRTELIMDQRGHDERIGNILSMLAFYVMKDGWKAAPGTVFLDMVSEYIPDTKLPHIMFTPAFQWDDMTEVELGNTTIYPLLAVPISGAESKLAEQNEGEDLENLWAEKNVDVFDWNRDSAV